MHQYQYTYGDRPLTGYTVHRAIGRGGFGEVYYAVSDSGREVALKAIGGYEQIELRGVSQCMNLKSPHLVTIFDIKKNAQGRSFVVMEYISGPSLRDLLDADGAGLGVAKAGYFLQEIAKGLSFLHGAGIVHRDLKPGNIFYEDGYVKIGDYGLSKAITPSRHEDQTITVGTVHYMAPEIGAGCYDRSIDIYALGIILYEMLTGRVPYAGDSHGEILMKHMMGSPDLTGIDEPMATAVRKALTKDPTERYPTVQAMAEEVLGADHVRMSVSGFRPESLSIAAAKVAPKPVIPPAIPAGRHPTKVPPGPPTIPRVEHNVAPPASAMDPLPATQRIVLGAVAMLIVAIGASILPGNPYPYPMAAVFLVSLMIAGGAAGLLAAWRYFRFEHESGFFMRLFFGAITALAGCAAALPAMMRFGAYDLIIKPTLLAIGISCLLIDWRARLSRTRWQRISLTLALTAGFCAFVIALVLDAAPALAVAVVAGISLVAQAATPMSDPQRRTGPDRSTTDDPPPQATPPRPPQASSSVEAASPYNRAIALVMCLLGFAIPIHGLHRFYTGKILTGIVWLCTVGLFGIGQLVDLVLLVVGQFRDARGRLVLTWDWRVSEPAGGAAATTASGSAAPAPRARHRPVDLLLSLIGVILFFGALLVGSAMAFDLPQMLRVGVFGPDVGPELTRNIGTPRWPSMVFDILTFATFILGVVTLCVLVIARRRAGTAHLARAVLAPIALAIGLLVLAGAADLIPWTPIAEHWHAGRIGPGLSLLFGSMNMGLLYLSVAMLFASVTLLAWPAPRLQFATNGERGNG